MCKKYKKHLGFTIVELLIVIVVIGILATVSIVAYRGIQERAQNAATVSSVRQYVQALNLIKQEKGEYPYERTADPAVSGNYWTEVLNSRRAYDTIKNDVYSTGVPSRGLEYVVYGQMIPYLGAEVGVYENNQIYSVSGGNRYLQPGVKYATSKSYGGEITLTYVLNGEHSRCPAVSGAVGYRGTYGLGIDVTRPINRSGVVYTECQLVLWRREG